MTTVKEEILLRIDADVKGLVSKIATGREELTTLQKKLSDLKTAQFELAKSGQQGTEAFKDLTKEIILQEQSIKATEKAVKSNQFALERQLTSQREQEGSLTQLRAQQSAANQAWDKLTVAQRENSEEGKALQKSISEINAKLKEQESQTGRNQRNVGNYKSALDGVREKLLELSNLRTEINKEGFENAQNTLDDINQGISDLAKQSQENFSKIEKELIDTGKTAIDQASSIRELTGLMKAYQDASLSATEESKQAFKDLAAEAKDKIDDIRQETANLASDTSTFDAIGQGVKTAVASFTLFQGASGLFGKENEDIQKAIEKTAQGLLVLNSVTEITNALQKQSSLYVKGTALAQGIWNGSLAVGSSILRVFGITAATSTVAVRGFTAALLATGIGALVVGLVLLYQNFDKVKESVSGASDSIIQTKGVLGALLAPIKAIIIPLQAAYDLFKNIGQAIGVLDNKQTESLKKNVGNLEKQSAAIQTRYDLEINLAKAVGVSTEALEQNKLKAQGDGIKKQIENLFRLQAANGKLNEDQQKNLDELKDSWRKNFNDIAVLQAENDAKMIQQSNDTSLALLNIELRKQATLGGDTSAKRKEIAAKERDAALSDQKLTTQQKAVIEEEYQQKILEIDTEGANARVQLDLSVQKAQADIMRDGREKEIAQERISLAEKLNAIKGTTTQENQLRELARKQSAENIREINKKFAEEEIQQMLVDAQNKINVERNLTEARDNLAIASAKTKGERLSADLQVINNQTAAAIAQAEQDKAKELADQDQRASESLDRLRASGDFKAATLREQQALETQLLNQGLAEREAIQQTYDAKELAILQDQANQTVEIYRQSNLEILNADAEFIQLKLDANNAGFDAELALKIQQLNLQEQTELSSKERTESEKTLIHNKYEKLRQQATGLTEDQKLAKVSETLGKTSELFAKNTAAYKALAISQNYIDTYRAATAALAPPPTGAGPLFGPLLAGATIVQGTLNAQKILSFEKGGYTGDGDPSSVSTALGPKPYTYHKSEYVIPAPVLTDPTVSSFVDAVIHPKVKGLRPSISSNSYASGGYAPSANAPVFITQSPSPEALAEALSRIKFPDMYIGTSELNQSLNNIKAVEQRGNV